MKKLIFIAFILFIAFSCEKEDFGDENKTPQETNLKSKTIKTYPYKYGDVYGVPIIEKSWEYDSNGLLTKYIFNQDNGNYFNRDKEEYYYDENNLLIERKEYSFSSLDYRYTYEYNEKKQCTKMVQHGEYSSQSYLYEYDNNGFLKKETWRFDDSGNIGRIKTFYKNQMGLDTLVIYDYSSSGVSEYRYKYDSKWNILSCDIYKVEDAENHNEYTNTYEYDEKGRIKRKTTVWEYVINFNGYYYSYDYTYLDNDSIESIDIDNAINTDYLLEDWRIEKYEYEYY